MQNIASVQLFMRLAVHTFNIVDLVVLRKTLRVESRAFFTTMGAKREPHYRPEGVSNPTVPHSLINGPKARAGAGGMLETLQNGCGLVRVTSVGVSGVVRALSTPHPFQTSGYYILVYRV